MSVFNGEKFLKFSIDSVLSQSFRDFEFIIINDFSSDNSEYIIKNYEKIDDRIRLINNDKNIGLTKSLNFGLGFCSGDFIARIDSDDIWKSDKLKEQYKLLQSNNNIVLCGTLFELINSNNEVQPNRYQSNLIDYPYKNPFIHSSIVFDRILAKNIGGYNQNFLFAQDFELIREFNIRGSIIILNKKLVQFRESADSISFKRRKMQTLFLIKSQLMHLLYTKNINKTRLFLFIVKNLFLFILPKKLYDFLKKIIFNYD